KRIAIHKEDCDILASSFSVDTQVAYSLSLGVVKELGKHSIAILVYIQHLGSALANLSSCSIPRRTYHQAHSLLCSFLPWSSISTNVVLNTIVPCDAIGAAPPLQASVLSSLWSLFSCLSDFCWPLQGAGGHLQAISLPINLPQLQAHQPAPQLQARQPAPTAGPSTCPNCRPISLPTCRPINLPHLQAHQPAPQLQAHQPAPTAGPVSCWLGSRVYAWYSRGSPSCFWKLLPPGAPILSPCTGTIPMAWQVLATFTGKGLTRPLLCLLLLHFSYKMDRTLL
ncbi:hypothetical protein LEMLEM_LOCUS6964, partial [Lemmus lemmus]